MADQFPTFDVADLSYDPQAEQQGDGGFYNSGGTLRLNNAERYGHFANINGPAVGNSNYAITSPTGQGNPFAGDTFSMQVKSGEKTGTYVTYKKQGDKWVPQTESVGTREWDTNPGGQNRGMLAVLAMGIGGAAMGAANMAAAGASGAGMAAGEGAMIGSGLTSAADLTGGVAAAGGAAAPAAAGAVPAGGSWGLVDSGALGAASGGSAAASGGGIIDRAMNFLNTPLGSTVVSGALKLAGGAMTPNETAMRLNAEEQVRQDNLNRVRANTNVAGLNFDKIPANSPRAALRKPGQVSVPSFDAFKVKAPTAPGLVGKNFKL